MTEFTNNQVKEIAKWQRAVLWLLLASIVAFTIPYAIWVVAIISAVCVYKLAKALGSEAAIGWAIGMFVPFLSLLLLLIINGRATSAIRSTGVGVGLMGASESQLAKLEDDPDPSLQTQAEPSGTSVNVTHLQVLWWVAAIASASVALVVVMLAGGFEPFQAVAVAPSDDPARKGVKRSESIPVQAADTDDAESQMKEAVAALVQAVKADPAFVLEGRAVRRSAVPVLIEVLDDEDVVCTKEG